MGRSTGTRGAGPGRRGGLRIPAQRAARRCYEAVEVARPDAEPLVLEVQRHLGDQPGAHRGHGHAPTACRGAPRPWPGHAHPRAGGRGRRWGGCSTCSAARSTARGRWTRDLTYPIHRPAPAFDEQSRRVEVFETGLEGHRPDRPLHPRRQDRHLRRRRGRQDDHHPGADPLDRHRAQGQLGLRRHRRAHPRGHADVPRDDRVRRAQGHGAGLRPDERAAGRAPARRA